MIRFIGPGNITLAFHPFAFAMWIENKSTVHKLDECILLLTFGKCYVTLIGSCSQATGVH